MNAPGGQPTLAEILRRTPRPYRLPDLPELNPASQDFHRRANWLAIVIEITRRRLESGLSPEPELKQAFLQTLAALIQDAMHGENGDTTFQAMVLRQSSTVVREYVDLATQQAQDTRRVHSLVNTVAHPAKLARQPAGPQRDALTRLQQLLSAEQWAAAAAELTALLKSEAPAPGLQSDSALEGTEPEFDTVSAPQLPDIEENLLKLAEDSALQRLQRLQALLDHEPVQRYRRLWAQQGPRANSHAAVQEGAEARRRGMDVETLTRDALQTVADTLNLAGKHPLYRVATSMYVPASLAAGHVGGKTEWDAVLLKQASGVDAGDASWDIELLVEAKASTDAIATDFPRLLRGLQLLTQADADTSYAFKAREGMFDIRGSSLSALPTEAQALEGTVLYCSDAAAEDNPRLLSAAARMQLLSAPESLAYATALARDGQAEPALLEPLWQQLLDAPQWQALLHQYLALAQARELMVHTDDLAAAAATT